MKKMRIAIIGQGRSGKDIHGKYFLSSDNDIIEVKYVVELLEERREIAKKDYNCEVLSDYRELFEKKDIDLVVNASFSQMHYDITKDLLNHGFNVLVEKPFGRTSFECMDLIKTAKEKGVIVAAFHQSLYAPSFKGVKEFIKSGILGEVFQISLKYSGFARRWDWQTVQRCCAGSVFNSGPHPIGQALDMLGWDKNFRVEYSDLKTVLTSGDAEDYGKIILKVPNKPTIDIEICSVDAYSDFVFKVYGSKGTLKATNESYELKRIEPEKLDPKPVTLKPLMDEEFRPLYCSEKLPIIEENGKFSGSSFDSAVKEYYEMLYATIMEGKPLEISPEMASEVIRVIEICHAQNPLPVKF